MGIHQSEPVKTFSIGFDNPQYDETRFAQMAARRFGTIHQSRIMTHDAAALWPRFIWHVDQPHGDVSFMPTDEVSRLAVQDVKMVLTRSEERRVGKECVRTFRSRWSACH